MVESYGINDMPKGWLSNELNKKIYNHWRNMLRRVYNEEFENTTYISVEIEIPLHYLSYFVEHYKEIEGYDDELFKSGLLTLDKDLKSDDMGNKVYSIETCMWLSREKNTSLNATTRTGKPRQKKPKFQQYTDYYYIATSVSDSSKSIKFGGIHSVKKFLEENGYKTYQQVYSCCNGSRENAYGFTWQRLDEKYVVREKFTYYPVK